MPPLTCAGCAAAWSLLCASPLPRPWGNRELLPAFLGGLRQQGPQEGVVRHPSSVTRSRGEAGQGGEAPVELWRQSKNPLRILPYGHFSSARILELEECHSGFHTDKFLPNRVAAVCC